MRTPFAKAPEPTCEQAVTSVMASLFAMQTPLKAEKTLAFREDLPKVSEEKKKVKAGRVGEIQKDVGS